MQISINLVRNSVSPQISSIIKTFNRSGMNRILRFAGEEFIRQTKSGFRSPGGKYKAKPWPALSPAYAKRIGSKQATLHRTGALYNSIKMNSPKGTYVEIYTKSPYGAAHQFGVRSRHLPARPFFPVESKTPSYSRLVFNSERDLLQVISKSMTSMSKNALPRLSAGITRSQYSYGNPFVMGKSGGI
jgi:phage gpG-like protein